METHGRQQGRETRAAAVLARKKQVLVPCTYHFYRQPPVLVRGSGLFLYDSEGKRYLDCFSGVSVNHLGHCHPAVTAAIREQAATLCHTTTIYLTEPMLDLAEQLVAVAPVDDGRVFFCASGSEANETAAFIAQHFTGRSGFAALTNSLHGNSKLTLSLTGVPFWKTDISPLPEVLHGPAPYCYRCPYERTEENCNLECAEALDDLIGNAGIPVAAMFLEIIQANGGIVVPPAKWFDRLRDILSRHEVLMIVDEVQTGFGRTGRLFASSHFDLKPELITVAKSIGGGLPLGSAIVNGRVAETFTQPRASTFGGNLVAARAGLAALTAIMEEKLPENAMRMGEILQNGLRRLMEQHPVIGDVRGLGLMIGAELVGEGKTPDPEAADMILEEMKEAGYLIGKAGEGRNVLVLMPPLIIGEEEINGILTTLERVLARLRFRQPKSPF